MMGEDGELYLDGAQRESVPQYDSLTWPITSCQDAGNKELKTVARLKLNLDSFEDLTFSTCIRTIGLCALAVRTLVSMGFIVCIQAIYAQCQALP